MFFRGLSDQEDIGTIFQKYGFTLYGILRASSYMRKTPPGSENDFCSMLTHPCLIMQSHTNMFASFLGKVEQGTDSCWVVGGRG